MDLNAQDDSIRAPFHKPGPGPHPIKHISAQFRGGQHAHVLSHSSNATAAAIIADINQVIHSLSIFVCYR